MVGETATIYVPKRKSEGRYEKTPLSITIRKKDAPVWAKHPKVDVAALYIESPLFLVRQSAAIPALSEDMFADDSMTTKFEIHAGDELLCLG